MNYPKPPLILDEKKLRAGIDNPSYEYAVNLKADLIAVYQCLIDNETDLNINLNFFENENKCGTYRCVAGWWAYWLNIPITAYRQSMTYRFEKIFCNSKFFMCFEELVVLDTAPCIKMFDLFFGDAGCGTLPERVIRAESLKIQIPQKNEMVL